MSIFKRPYEISLWEDRLTVVDSNGKEYEGLVPNNIQILTSYYKEKKIATIGSYLFKGPNRVINPQLKRKIDGSNTLTFSIYARYLDEETGEFVNNPFLPYLINERKVKIKYSKKGKWEWLDFIIKNVEENSETFLYTYTATDLFINELSKTGLNLIFDANLNNNYGSAQQLGASILQGTDWQIGEATEIIQQKKQEALYEIVLNTNIVAFNIKDDSMITIPAGEVIYAFYSSVTNKEQDFFQFVYSKDNIYQTDQDRLLINVPSFYFSFKNPEASGWPYFAESVKYTNKYRAERLVRQQKSVYDETIDKTVLLFSDEDGKEVRGYIDTKFITQNNIYNYFINNKDFSSTSGWQHSDPEKTLSLDFVPSFEIVPKVENRLQIIGYEQSYESYLVNYGFKDNIENLESLIEGEEYCFRIKWGSLSQDGKIINTPSGYVKFFVAPYDLNEEAHFIIDFDKMLFTGIAKLYNNGVPQDPEGYFSCEVQALKSLSKTELRQKKYSIFIQFFNEETNSYLLKNLKIQDAQFFKIQYDLNGNKCLPNGKAIQISSGGQKVLVDSVLAYKKEIKIFYYPDKEAEKIEDLVILSEREIEKLQPQYNDNYEKIRTITARDSNRFNLLQKVAETFGCWCRFDVKHKETGEILLGKDIEVDIIYDGGTSKRNIEEDSLIIDGQNAIQASPLDMLYIDSDNLNIEKRYHQQKFVTFHSTIGQKNNIDYVYGVNLKSIKRKVESSDIVSKLIVKPNNNQFAQNGICSIVTAQDNPTGESFILNMHYYLNQGLLNYDNFYNDLYSLEANKGWLGYYTKLKNFNIKLQDIGQDLVLLQQTLTPLEGQLKELQLNYDKTTTLLKEAEEHFYSLTGVNYKDIDSESALLKDSSVIADLESINFYQNNLKQITPDLTLTKGSIEAIKNQLIILEQNEQNILIQKQELQNTFEQKYSRFIQEAPWSSEDYTDNNLYYLDAESTLYKSAQPKIEYTINVLELSSLPEYENYTYSLGDITNIQDPEFFGWVYKNGIKTPYKEPIIVTEENIFFDEPEKDSIKVQNYRTQFEDLFQRLTASTQKVEFYSGAYDKVASIVNSDGTISSSALSDAFSNNKQTIKNIANQSVTWDDKGIVTTNLSNPSEIVRITSGGIFLTTDGGNTWTTGITGTGINAQTITTGHLNTEKITIMSGGKEAFRWDANGLSAYRRIGKSYNINSFVRFDEYGIYGINGKADFKPTSLDDIWNNASFSLSWRGFRLKNEDQGGSISIDNTDDFCIKDSKGQIAIKIGRVEPIYENKNVYGIIINDSAGRVAFKATPENGLTVGGWSVTKDTIETRGLDEDGNPEVVLISSDVLIKENQRVICGQPRQDWRIIAGSKFGVTSDGALYADELNTTTATISSWTIEDNKIISSKEYDANTNKYQQVELNAIGVNLKIYDALDSSFPSDIISTPWKKILVKT